MPKATVTVRELKNKDTGVDLSVPSYQELPGLLRSTFEYQIVVVSSLSCFKLPSHKESDVVQFTLFKKFSDFEDLRARLTEVFSGTVLPPVVKKSIIVNDAVAKERRKNLDSFLKFLAATPRIITSSPVLIFLGVDAQKARRFASGESDESASKEKDDEGDGDKNTGEQSQDKKPEEMSTSNLFDDDDDDDDDGGEDFLSASNAIAQTKEGDFFSATELHSPSATNTRLFESQDLKRELTEEDEKDFAFIPDAIVTKREIVKVSPDDSNDDLLTVDTDIDMTKLLTLEAQESTRHMTTPNSEQELDVQKPSPSAVKPPVTSVKPTVPKKPTPSAKPTTAFSKPPVPSKPTSSVPVPSPRPSVPERPGNAAPGAARPVPAERPKPAPRKLKPHAVESAGAASASSGETKGSSNKQPEPDLTSVDIMQYIAANTQEGDADLDLFS